MWLFKSSIGRKFVMAVTGICLVLFVTFHVLMNSVALLWPTAYNQVCEFLGANWYALIASAGLALLFIIHIIYAVWLTVQNRAARGADRYAVTSRPAQVEWASKNMLVLGIVILAFLAVHLVNFWAKMQLPEMLHCDLDCLTKIDGVPANPAMGTLFIQMAFSELWVPVVYIIGFVALWFHMTHGFWSMFHSVGWDNSHWLNRLKCIANWWTSIVVALFVAQAVVFTVMAQKNYYTTNQELQEQYAEFWNAQAEAAVKDFNDGLAKVVAPIVKEAQALTPSMENQAKLMDLQNKYQEAQNEYIKANGTDFIKKYETITKGFEKQCPDVAPSDEMNSLEGYGMKVKNSLAQFTSPMGAAMPQ